MEENDREREQRWVRGTKGKTNCDGQNDEASIGKKNEDAREGYIVFVQCTPGQG